MEGYRMSANRIVTVLVVEADLMLRKQLCNQLSSAGYRATCVGSISETLALPKLEEFRAILVDWNLPDGTASDLLPHFNSRAPDAASIIVTGEDSTQASVEALRHGAIDYLVKPVNPNCLQASLARIEQLRECRKRFAQCERLATIGQAVTSVAHESRSALQRIQSQVELMELAVGGDQDRLDELRVIKSASHSLRCMFEELREFAAPITLRKERCHLRELMSRAWQSLALLPEARLACLELDGTDLQLTVDPVRMEQVFRNLFENALAACSAPARIQVTWRRTRDSNRNMLRILVRDNGVGFTPDQKEKAFEPFFTTKSKGTGLGLPICNRILDQHQGWLEIAPSSGMGACMVLMLPLVTRVKRQQAVAQPVCQLV
jgi:signal transduction histidine kinase